MNPLPERKTERLRHGRVSIAGARYFITCVIAERSPVFAAPDNAATLRLLAALERVESDRDATLLACVIMPDHVHLLCVLGERLSVSQLVAKLKRLARAPDATWRWQANFFERRLRADEDSEDYARYVFLNPYRAGLVPRGGPWWGWRASTSRPWRWRFETALKPDGTPPPEWLAQPERVVAGE